MAPLDIFPTINSLTILCMCVPAEKPRPGAMLRAPLPHPSFFPLLPTRCPACLFLPTPQAAQVCVCPACKSPGFFTSPRKIAVRARHLHFFLGFFFFFEPFFFRSRAPLPLAKLNSIIKQKKKTTTQNLPTHFLETFIAILLNPLLLALVFFHHLLPVAQKTHSSPTSIFL